MHCAWMSRRDWTEPFLGPDEIGPPPNAVRWKEIAVCPGAALVHPFIREVIVGHMAMEKGSLETFFPEPTHALLDGILLFTEAKNAEEHRRLTKKPMTPPAAFPWTKR